MIWELAETSNPKMNLQLWDGEKKKKKRSVEDKKNNTSRSAALGAFYGPIYFPYFLNSASKKDQAFFILMSRLADRIRPQLWLTISRPNLGQIDACGEWSFIIKQIWCLKMDSCSSIWKWTSRRLAIFAWLLFPTRKLRIWRSPLSAIISFWERQSKKCPQTSKQLLVQECEIWTTALEAIKKNLRWCLRVWKRRRITDDNQQSITINPIVEKIKEATSQNNWKCLLRISNHENSPRWLWILSDYNQNTWTDAPNSPISILMRKKKSYHRQKEQIHS